MLFFFVLVDLLVTPTALQRVPGHISYGSNRVALSYFLSTAVSCAGLLLSRAGVSLQC